MCVGVPLQCGYGGVVSVCSLKQSNNKTSGIKLVSLYSTIKMMHDPINIRFVMSICMEQLGSHVGRIFTQSDV